MNFWDCVSENVPGAKEAPQGAGHCPPVANRGARRSDTRRSIKEFEIPFSYRGTEERFLGSQSPKAFLTGALSGDSPGCGAGGFGRDDGEIDRDGSAEALGECLLEGASCARLAQPFVRGRLGWKSDADPMRTDERNFGPAEDHSQARRDAPAFFEKCAPGTPRGG